MGLFRSEAEAFRSKKGREIIEARQQAAFFLVSGIDLATALKTTGTERAAICMRLARLIERERLKGIRRHWSYDINRHIALKQAYDRLRRSDSQ
ncbi:cytoplasmic protein [Chelativorans sp. Marseille-P2723]|uniref:cytoplasmic protein n=1 Tax=Chelativorans sp. Marseille-P2723 TaxID=2709133 RepID=UPI00156FC6E8|nr:cytoplasmic protein [Chelativorans sp. Marseille-P2723]